LKCAKGGFARQWEVEEIPRLKRHDLLIVKHILPPKYTSNGKVGGKVQ
jgi:hypothetical protein